MRWFSFLPRQRAALLRACLLLVAAAFAFAPRSVPSAAPLVAPVPAAGEEATPDSVAPLGPGTPARQRQQILARLGVNRWHAAGHRGRGVKIAILDSGFRGYQRFLGGALPAHVTVRSFRDDGNLEARDSQHGILCAEVLHALAPEAELLLANWEPDRPDRFLDAARWARAQGARVLSCSLIMPSWSDGEGGGAVNAALADILGSGTAAGDPLLFASAGNTALRHWCGAFRPDADGLHQWRDGITSNLLTPWGNDRVSVELYGPAAGGFEVSVHDALTGQQVGRAAVRRATKARAAGTCAVVRWTPLPQHRYEVRVRTTRAPSDPAEPFHLVVLGGGLQHATARGSIPCPADGRAVSAVGAVDTEGRRHGYSSCGPNSRLPKPDFVAEVPFPSLWRDRPFAGTSAAAPQAAGIAALVWSRHPDWTARQVTTAMRGAAVDLGPPGHDCETGYGRIALP